MVERAVRRRQTTSHRPRWAGSTRSRTAPLEVGRSSSQSALSERPGRWNGRVERGAESARKRDCSHGDCPPTLVGLRGGRLSLTADLSYEPPSPRDARPAHTWGRAPACTVPHASRGLWLERDRKRVPQAGARLPREERERGTSLVSRHAGACTAVQKLSQPLEWLLSRPSPGRTGSRRWRRRGRSRRRTGSRRSCGGRRSRRAAGRRNA